MTGAFLINAEMEERIYRMKLQRDIYKDLATLDSQEDYAVKETKEKLETLKAAAEQGRV